LLTVAGDRLVAFRPLLAAAVCAFDSFSVGAADHESNERNAVSAAMRQTLRRTPRRLPLQDQNWYYADQ